MARIWLIALLVQFFGGNYAAQVNNSVKSEQLLQIKRCCRFGEDLEPTNEASSGEAYRCVPTSTSDVEALRFGDIYSPEINNFLSEPPAHWRVLENARPICPEPQMYLRYIPRNQFNPYVVFVSGDVLIEATSDVILSLEQFCLGSKALLACLPRNNESLQAASTIVPQIRKCCGELAAYNIEKNSCVETGDKVTLEDEQILLLNSNENNGKVAAAMKMVSGSPKSVCEGNLTIIGEVRFSELQNDGSIIVAEHNIPAEEFCIERIQAKKSNDLWPVKVFACSEHAIKVSGVPIRDIRFTLYPVGFIISAVFLAATLATSWLLPASHHMLHWRCQTHHVACLMLGDIAMAVIQLGGTSLQGEFCRVLAILAHFFFLATFFWLNTMCFNIWWTFRDLRPANLEKGQEMLRLRFYSAYAWGGPLIVTGLAAFLDHLPETPGQTFLRPRFGEKQCWFYGDMEIFAYFFGPIGILLAINLLFFAATAHELTCGLWKGELVKSTTERAALGKVCLKLVIVMGVPWIFDVLSWMAGGPDFLWYVTDLCNAAQGVLIFLVVGCQPQVRTALKRLWSRNPRANSNRQGNGLSTTSHGMPSMGDSFAQNPSTKTAPLETIC